MYRLRGLVLRGKAVRLSRFPLFSTQFRRFKDEGRDGRPVSAERYSFGPQDRSIQQGGPLSSGLLTDEKGL